MKTYNVLGLTRLLLLFLILNIISTNVHLTGQEVTFRLFKPLLNCPTNDELCFEVEIQADQTGIELDEVNIRMFIDDARLSFLDFRNPDPLYFLETGGNTQTGQANSGSFFGFEGEFIYIIDNLKRVGAQGVEIATAPDWTYLFEACFTDPISNNFCITNNIAACEYIVWDHDLNGSGFATGSDGIEALAVNPNGGPGISLDEAVIHLNWDYFMPDPNLDEGECAGCCTFAIPDLVDVNIFQKECKQISINWSVTEELGNEGTYYIERRYAGNPTWETIGELHTIAQQIHNVYTFDDLTNRRNSKAFYRIRFIDIFKEADILVEKEFESTCAKTTQLYLYPNPTADHATLELSGELQNELTYDIYDIAGKKQFSKTLKIDGTVDFISEQLHLSQLSQGSYIIEIKHGQNRECLIFQKISE